MEVYCLKKFNIKNLRYQISTRNRGRAVEKAHEKENGNGGEDWSNM